MKRLGYVEFVAQGGDWGAIITELMGAQAPPELLGIHTNMPNVIPLDIDKAAFSGAPAPTGLSAEEAVAYERLSFVYAKGIGYGFQMGLRPQTLYGIADSPVGLAAYFLDHDARSYELIARVFNGQSEVHALISVRITSGTPNSLKVRSKTVKANRSCVVNSASHVSR
jgi:hypothetical protein